MKKRNANEEKLSNVVDSFINQFGLKKRSVCVKMRVRIQAAVASERTVIFRPN